MIISSYTVLKVFFVNFDHKLGKLGLTNTISAFVLLICG